MTARRPDSFYALGVRPALAEALAARGIVAPFEIQAASLPDSLAGRDVLGRGRTGSGKTVAFALPVIERVLEAEGRRRPHHPRALVLVPTRELAVQVAETVEYLAKAERLKTMTVFGGVRYTGQLRKLERGVDIVVATPGRLEDLIAQGAMKLDDIRVVVLDEADLMADMGFLQPVTRILDEVPAGQRLLFSATLDKDVAKLVKKFLSDPLDHSVDADESAPVAKHFLFGVRHDNKPAIVRELLGGGGRTLAFTRTKHAAERLAAQLTEGGIPAVELHGNLRQAARQRNLSAFADGTISVLVATDIAARGIHVDNVGLVVHIDPPNDPKAFLHRSGRTARAGDEGTVVTLATRNQNHAVRAMMTHAGIKPAQHVVSPGDPILTEVRAARVEPKESGTSIFEPDPEDTVEEHDEGPARDDRGPRRDDRGPRGGGRYERTERAWGRSDRPQRGDRPERKPWGRDRDQGSERAPFEYHPRREPKEHTSGARGPRPDRGEIAARRERVHAERPGRRGGEFSADWWGPEPWEVDENSDRRSERRGGDRRPDQGGRPSSEGRSWAPRGDDRRPWQGSGREDRRPRPGRDARRDARDARSTDGDRPGYEGRSYGERRPYGEGRPAGERRPYEARSGGANRPYDNRGQRDQRGFGDDRGPRGFRDDRGPRGFRDDRGAGGDRGGRRDFDRDARDRRDDRGAERAPSAGGSASEPRTKSRWSADDRRKAAESKSRGFSYTKGAPKGQSGKGRAKGKPAAGRTKPRRPR